MCSLSTDLEVYYSKGYVCLHRTERHWKVGRISINKEMNTSLSTTAFLLDEGVCLIELHVST